MATLSAKARQERKEKFVAAYLGTNPRNATQAAIAIGVPPKGAKVWACETMKDPWVKEHIDKETNAQIVELKEKSNASFEGFIETLWKLAQEADTDVARVGAAKAGAEALLKLKLAEMALNPGNRLPEAPNVYRSAWSKSLPN